MQALVVKINNNFYGFDMSQVHEITTKVKITRVPNARETVKGVANLRGKIVPIVDLRKLLDLKESTSCAGCFVFFRLNMNQIIGVHVDEISKTINLSPEQIRPAPVGEQGTDLAGALVGLHPEPGLDTPVILLDINKLFSVEEQIDNSNATQNL